LGWQWHQLDRMQTICTSLQTDNHTNTSSLNFYRLDALPGVQQTVTSTEGNFNLNLITTTISFNKFLKINFYITGKNSEQ